MLDNTEQNINKTGDRVNIADCGIPQQKSLYVPPKLVVLSAASNTMQVDANDDPTFSDNTPGS